MLDHIILSGFEVLSIHLTTLGFATASYGWNISLTLPRLYKHREKSCYELLDKIMTILGMGLEYIMYIKGRTSRIWKVN